MRLLSTPILGLLAFFVCFSLTIPVNAQNIVSALFAEDGAFEARFSLKGEKGMEGVLLIRPVEGSEKNVFIVREIVTKGGAAVRLKAKGVLLKSGELAALFPYDAPSTSWIDFSQAVQPVKATKQYLVANGLLTGKTLELTIRNDTGDVIREKWVLDSINAHKPFLTETIEVAAQKWTPIPLPKGSKGLLRLQIKGAKQPRGVFGSRKAPPKLPSVKVEDFDMALSQAALSYPAPGLPSFFDREGAPVWVMQDGALPKGAEPIDDDMVFWFIDDADIAELLQMEFRWVNLFPGGFEIECDPFVDINVTPSRIAPGEEVTITVTASASAGIRDYTWNTVATPASTAEGMSIPGDGRETVSGSWRRRFSAPGFYRFRAAARDMSNRRSRGQLCGDDEVELIVLPDARKSYSVGFILLVPPSMDTTTTEFNEQLIKLSRIKTEFEREFRKATDFTGEAIASPTFIIQPILPPIGVEDENGMYDFLRRTARDQFYDRRGDDYDFLAFYELFPEARVVSRHWTLRTAVAGFGIREQNRSGAWGAPNLRGFGAVTDLSELPSRYSYQRSRMHLLLHEVFGHQWGVYARDLTRPGSHYGTGIQADAHTVLYARPWRQMGPGQFEVQSVTDRDTGEPKVIFHPWTLYVAGLKTRAEVPASVLNVNPNVAPSSRYDVYSTTGSAETITLQQIIDREGDRYDVPR